MSENEITIDDIVLDIPEAKSKGFLRRQIQAADHQMALMDTQQKLADAQADIDKISKGKVTPKQEQAAYAKFHACMKSYKDSLLSTVDYIMGFVKEPADKVAAREIVLELSEDDYRAILNYIQKGAPGDADEGVGDENPTE